MRSPGKRVQRTRRRRQGLGPNEHWYLEIWCWERIPRPFLCHLCKSDLPCSVLESLGAGLWLRPHCAIFSLKMTWAPRVLVDWLLTGAFWPQLAFSYCSENKMRPICVCHLFSWLRWHSETRSELIYGGQSRWLSNLQCCREQQPGVLGADGEKGLQLTCFTSYLTERKCCAFKFHEPATLWGLKKEISCLGVLKVQATNSVGYFEILQQQIYQSTNVTTLPCNKPS